MWQRFTERARRVVFFAQEEAARLGENYVGTEHILLGLVREHDSVAARILDRLGVPLGRIRSDVERQVTRGHGNLGQDMQLTPRAKRVIDLSYEEARQLNNNYIGTEHLLLGLIREGDGLAARVLVKLGADLERTRREVYAMQEGENQPSAIVGRGGSGRYFTNEILCVLQFAREEAPQRREGYVGTEHLLLGLTHSISGSAHQALKRLGVPPSRLRAAVERQAIGSPPGPLPRMPFTWHALQVIDQAHEEARQSQSDYVGAEHLLLALLAEGDTVAALLLQKAGAGEEHVRSKAREFLSECAKGDEPRAGRSVSRAQEEAQQRAQPAVSTEHLLLAMIRDEESVAARILKSAGVSLDSLRSDLEQEIGPGYDAAAQAGSPEAAHPLTPRSEAVIDRASEEAERLRSIRIGSEHLLLGLALEGDSFGGQILQQAGVSLDRLLEVIPAAMAGGAPRPRAIRAEAEAPGPGRQAPAAPSFTPAPADAAEGGGPKTAPPARQEHLSDPATWASMSWVRRQQAVRAAVASARAVVTRDGRLLDFISINDLTPGQARELLSLALALKASGDSVKLAHREILPGKVLAMIFEKPSLRTRVTFETGMFQLGGHAVSLQPAEIMLGQRETVADAARNLERWVDGIMARTFRHQHVVELAQNAGVPVINGLTDHEHPCQALADFLTIREKKGRTEGLKLAFIGDGNNVAHSLLLLGAKLGAYVTVAGPEGYEPDAEILRLAREAGAATAAQIEVTHDPVEAVRDADIIYTDVWASMGQEAEAKERAARFAPFQVNAELIRHAKQDAIVMHDLPAHRGQEITDDVMDGPQAVIFDQAENRLHAQKALLAVLLG